MTTELQTAEQRAVMVLNSTKTEADLNQLATSLKAITLVNSQAGREQAHALAMTARSARTTIEKAGKAARDDATKFSKAVIAEEGRLIEIIQPEEIRVLGLRNAWDAAEAARKEAEAQKERDRIAAHQAVIERIRSLPGLAREARTADMALQLLAKLHAIDLDGLEEFKDAAVLELMRADKSILEIIEAKQAAEAEQARIKAEQAAEAERLAEQARAQEAERLALEQQRQALAEETAKLKAELEALQAARTPAQATTPVLTGADVSQYVVNLVASQMSSTTVEEIKVDDNKAALSCGVVKKPNPKAVPSSVPSAITLAKAVSYAFAVSDQLAIDWLAERADEFKSMNTITEVTA